MIIDAHVHPVLFGPICKDPERVQFRKQQFARSNRSMLPLPAALGAIRLTSVEDEVLDRHAHAYLASRKELL